MQIFPQVYKESPSPIIGAARGYQPNRVNQRIRFVEDDDPGIMSEVETSATVGAYSRRNMRVRQYHNESPNSTNMINNNFVHTSTSSVSNLPFGPEKSVGKLSCIFSDSDVKFAMVVATFVEKTGLNNWRQKKKKNHCLLFQSHC